MCFCFALIIVVAKHSLLNIFNVKGNIECFVNIKRPFQIIPFFLELNKIKINILSFHFL